MPTFNVSYEDDTIYLNSSIGYVDFNYSIETSDPEGDTIYYAYKLDTNLEVSNMLTFDNVFYDVENPYDDPSITDFLYWIRNGILCKMIDSSGWWGLCTNTEKYGVVAVSSQLENNVLSDFCEIGNRGIYSYSEPIRLGFTPETFYTVLIDADNCTSRIEVINDLQPIYDSSGTFQYRLIFDNNTVFKTGLGYLSFFVTEYIFNYTGTTLLIFNETGTLLYNGTKDTVLVNYKKYGESQTYDISVYDTEQNLLFSELNAPLPYDTVSSIIFQGSSGIFQIDDFLFYKTSYTANWSTTPTIPLTFYETGIFPLTIYVTDDQHNDTFSNYYHFYITVNPIEAKPIYQDETNFLKTIGYNFFSNFLDDLGIKQKVWNMAWLGFLFTFVLIYLGIMNFKFTLITTSFLFMWLGWFGLTSVPMLLSCMVLFALGLLPEISGLIK